MKKYVRFEELGKLKKAQKETLRKLWKPVKYELIFVPFLKDIDKEIYDNIIYVIQDIIVCNKKNGTKYCDISSYRGDISACSEIIFKALPLEDLKFLLEVRDNICEGRISSNKKLDIDCSVPVYYINKNNCLPLLDVSIMIEILYEKCCKKDFLLELNKEEKICVIDGITQYSDSLCDSLWGVLKSLL